MEVAPAVKPTSKAGASYNETRTLVGSFAAGGVKCSVVPVHLLWVVVEKGALAGICVVLVMPLVRVLVCVVLDPFVGRCNGVVV